LIIPCHRVVRTDGRMGGFSAPGGISLKKEMLELERQAVKA
jgi:O6-methylguanine-DNA--protein-cysteine methyltransferase